MTLPGNKTLTLGAICLSLVAGIGAYKIGEARKISLLETNSANAVYIDLQKTNEENNILQDALKNINLDAALGSTTETNPFAPSENDTMTDALAKNFFLTYAQTESGQLSLSDEELSNNVLGSIDTSSLPKPVFTLSDVTISTSNQNSVSIKAYANQVGAIIKDNYEYISRERNTIGLAEIAEIHQKIGREIIKIPAPPALAQQHLSISNDFVLMGDSYLAISSNEKEDPLKALLAIKSAQESAIDLDESVAEINSYFEQNAILFNIDEPGLILSRLTLK